MRAESNELQPESLPPLGAGMGGTSVFYAASLERPERAGAAIELKKQEELAAGLESGDLIVLDQEADGALAEIGEKDMTKAWRAVKAGKMTVHRVPRFSTVGEIQHALATSDMHHI